MSTISTIHDNMISRLSAVLTSHNRLPLPESPERNPTGLLRLGYGVMIGAGSNSEREIGGLISIARRFTVVLTREMLAIEGDASGRATAHKQLFEDQLLVIRDFMSHEDLGGGTGSTIYTKFLDDDGVELIDGLESGGSFLITRLDFETEYFESLT